VGTGSQWQNRLFCHCFRPIEGGNVKNLSIFVDFNNFALDFFTPLYYSLSVENKT
jgi:hypothetical protein